MTADSADNILRDPRFKGKPITWEVTPEEYEQIRHAWLTHVAAEERLFVPHTDAEWETQMKIMLSVFTDDCVMELVQTGERWQGKAETEMFYRAFIQSFDEMAWVPQALVIGPQGVLDVVNMTGLLRRAFARLSEVGKQLHLQWVIHFPWAAAQSKLRGETIHSIRSLTEAELSK